MYMLMTAYGIIILMHLILKKEKEKENKRKQNKTKQTHTPTHPSPTHTPTRIHTPTSRMYFAIRGLPVISVEVEKT